jgi:hypothetical protein
MSTTAPGRSQLRTIASYPYAVPDGLATSGPCDSTVVAPHAATMPSPLVTSCRVAWLRSVAIAPSTSRFLPEMTDWMLLPDAWLIAENSSPIGKKCCVSVYSAWLVGLVGGRVQDTAGRRRGRVAAAVEVRPDRHLRLPADHRRCRPARSATADCRRRSTASGCVLSSRLLEDVRERRGRLSHCCSPYGWGSGGRSDGPGRPATPTRRCRRSIWYCGRALSGLIFAGSTPGSPSAGPPPAGTCGARGACAASAFLDLRELGAPLEVLARIFSACAGGTGNPLSPMQSSLRAFISRSVSLTSCRPCSRMYCSQPVQSCERLLLLLPPAGS